LEKTQTLVLFWSSVFGSLKYFRNLLVFLNFIYFFCYQKGNGSSEYGLEADEAMSSFNQVPEQCCTDEHKIQLIIFKQECR